METALFEHPYEEEIRMKRLAVIFAATAVLGAWPAASNAATFKGVVVAHQRGALLVASSAGVVRAVSGSASIGARVVLSGGHATVVGRARTARVRGIVVRRVGTTVFLSSNSHLVAVHTGRRAASVSDTTPTPATPTTPAPGDVVSSQVTIQNGELDEEASEDLGSSGASQLQVQATVSAVGVGTVTLTVGTQTLTVPLPGGLTLPVSLVGQTVTLSLSLNGDNANGDDDNNDDQGGGDHGGNSGHGGNDG
jgi:hypothetical protein